MVSARLAYSYFEFALEGLGVYLRDPKGDDVGRDRSYLSDKLQKALTRLQAARELLHGPDDAEPPQDLLAALGEARDAVVDVDSITEAKKYAVAAIDNADTARVHLGQLTGP
jgi:hypothetical protein